MPSLGDRRNGVVGVHVRVMDTIRTPNIDTRDTKGVRRRLNTA